jgi:hypothetical protein
MASSAHEPRPKTAEARRNSKCELAEKARCVAAQSATHRAGAKVFVDNPGKKPSLLDSVTDEFRDVELFVMTLGAPSYTCEATDTQRLASCACVVPSLLATLGLQMLTRSITASA